MRRLRTDLPYTFRPPQGRGWFRPLGLWANERVFLRRKYRLEGISEAGMEQVEALVKKGDAVLLAPNHADHSDPHLMIEMGRRHALPLHFMAAREVFEGSPAAAWALQSMGVFSVDRDGPDLSAIKTAIGLLEAGTPLVIYPEGEIYHHHERLDPLMEGVASILLKAAGRLKDGRRAWLVPVGICFQHRPEVEATFGERLSKLEDRIGWTPRPAMAVDDRIIRLGTGVLALKETEFLGEAGQGGIQSRLEVLCERLLSATEEKHGRDPRATTAPERVRALRYRIRRRLLDAENPASTTERVTLLDDLDAVFTALQSHSYIGDYLLSHPSLDRRAETLMKLEEDLFGFPTYPTPRDATVTAADPIPVSDFLENGTLPSKGGAAPLTAMLEEKLTALLPVPE
ncbi:lysophospholipid acyltransferase family protein [Haloferula sargassicola]|uniref:Phospholipid/glycerol acyltransferase domain-containing protein n=1 Tax=Haloferula sargassicola TaxID=490096 RepID=A0ABP9UTV9_9BACT